MFDSLSFHEILQCHRSNKRKRTRILSCGTVCYAVQGGEPRRVLDAKYFHPTGSGANSQKPRPEPTLMSAYFPEARGTLPTT